MTNINVIETKISSAREYLKILNGFKKYSQEEIKKNIILKGALERYLYLVIQDTIGLAEAIISFKDFKRPGSYSEAFYILEKEKVISPELAEKLIKMTGFRNIVVHDYKKLDFGIVYNVLQDDIKDINNFISEIEKYFNLK